MSDNSLLIKKNVQEFTEFIEAIPYLKNENYTLKSITYKNTKEYTQALLNSLISKSYIKNVYSIFDNKINIKNIKYYVRNHDINLLINLRHIYFDNTFRYIAGYIPQKTQPSNYYLYSQISPANQYHKEDDYLFFSVDYYKDYFIPCELSTLRRHLVAIPIFLKHFYKIKKYLYDIAEIKRVLISDLQKNNCTKYIKMISELDETDTFDYKYIDRENQEDYFHILFAYHFQRSLNVKTLNIDSKTRSNMFYLMLVNKNLDTLPLDLPDIVKYDNFEFNNNDNKQYNLTTYKPTYKPNRPTDPPPPPPLPKFKPVCKYEPKEDFKPETVITLSNEKLNEFISKNTAKNNNTGYLDELKSKISKFKKYIGGETLDNNKVVTFNTPENKDMYANISQLDHISDYIVEQNNYKLPIVSSINRNPNINSIEKTSNLFFTNLSGFERFSQTNFFKKKINLIYEFLKQDKDLGLITFEFNSFYFNIFIISHKVDDLGLLHLFNNYFSIIKEYLIYLNTNSDSIFFLKDNFVQLGAIVLKLLDIFSIYTINKVVPFRHYMKNYYQTLRLINNSMASSVSLYSTLLNLLQSFKKNIMEPLIGGNHTSIKMFDVNKYETLYFYDYVYLLDGVTHLQYNNTGKSDYYKCTINDITPNNEIYKFFDGIEFNKFIKMLPNQQYVLSTVNKTMFLINLKEGTKMLFKKTDNYEDTRICFVIRQLTDKYTAYDLIKELSNTIKSDYVSIQKLEDFLYKFNIIIDNVKLNDLLKRLNKIETPIEAPILLNYYKSIKNEDSTEKNTLIELFLFLFYFLVKIGFDVSHFMTKSSIIINVTPELSKENILQHFEKNKELSKIAKDILKDNEDLFEFLINSSIKISINQKDKIIENNDEEVENIILGGKTDGNYSKFVFKLPQNNNILENNISDNVLNLYNNNVDSDILTTNFDNIFEKETLEFQDNLDILISTDNINMQNLYKIIPNYIITQSNLVDNFDILSNKEKIAGGSSEENHPIKIFLEKYTNTSGTSPGSVPVPREFVVKNIDMILQEQYFKTLDKLVLFYDNKLLADHKYNTNSTIIRNIINSMEYMRKYYKVDFDENIKLGIVTLINNLQSTDEIIYQTFVVIQYIKHFIIYMYKKLGINFDEYNISINDFSIFYKIIEPRFIDRAKYMKTMYDINIKNSFDKLNLTNDDDFKQSAYTKIGIDDIKSDIFFVHDDTSSTPDKDPKPDPNGPKGPTPDPNGPKGPTLGPKGPTLGPKGPTLGPNGPTPDPNGPTPPDPASPNSSIHSSPNSSRHSSPNRSRPSSPTNPGPPPKPNRLQPPKPPSAPTPEISRGAGMFDQLNNMVSEGIQNN